MAIRFAVLGSGSTGNASLLEADGFGLLIDAGLGSRQIAARLAAVGRTWDAVDAAILTHVHADHWKETTLRLFARREIALYCHAEQAARLREWSEGFRDLESAGLIRTYSEEAAVRGASGQVTVRPVPVSHDGGPTFGFRIECGRTLFGPAWAMAYATDLGTWGDGLLQHFADVDLLAIEFNHDADLQRHSGRPPDLIARVLGDEGHLSNEQAGNLLGEVLRASPGRLRSVVQLHLSRDCNRPQLARRAADRVLNERGGGVRVHTAKQHAPIEMDGMR